MVNLSNIKLMTLLLLLASCGKVLPDWIDKGDVPYDAVNMSPYFAQYLKDNDLVSYTPIVFGETNGVNYAGVCNKWSDGYKDIKIKQSYWDNTSDKEKYSLIKHEIGHCDLNLKHNDEMRISGCPKSMMNTYTVSLYCLKEHWDSYISEF